MSTFFNSEKLAKQHISNAIDKGTLCSIFQRYNLKAIHNNLYGITFSDMAVLNISKIQSESNSQRIDIVLFVR